jgi:hypothetical protein
VQASGDLGVLDEVAVLVDVRHRYAAFDEHLRQQLRAVAVGWTRLAAEEGESVPLAVDRLYPLNSTEERRRGPAAVVVDVGIVVVAGRVVRPSAKRLSERET